MCMEHRFTRINDLQGATASVNLKSSLAIVTNCEVTALKSVRDEPCEHDNVRCNRFSSGYSLRGKTVPTRLD